MTKITLLFTKKKVKKLIKKIKIIINSKTVCQLSPTLNISAVSRYATG